MTGTGFTTQSMDYTKTTRAQKTSDPKQPASPSVDYVSAIDGKAATSRDARHGNRNDPSRELRGNLVNVTDIATRWLEMLQQPDSDEFAELFTEDGMYIDPAYGVVQHGRDFVRLHHHMWHASIPDFKTKVERVLVDGSTAVILYQGTGTYSGEPIAAGEKHQPTNRPFKARVVIVLDLDDNGLVKCCTEYYDRSIMPMGEGTPYGQDLVEQE